MLKITKYYTFLVLIFAFSESARSNPASFTISAEVERSAVIGSDESTVMNYIGNVDDYAKDFPNVISVKHSSGGSIELVYRVESPLASPFDITFLLTERSEIPDKLILESMTLEPDYFYSSTSFKNTGPTQTSVSIHLKVRITREKASDIHFMAGILGEDYISARMKEKLGSGLETFLSNVQNELSGSQSQH